MTKIKHPNNKGSKGSKFALAVAVVVAIVLLFWTGTLVFPYGGHPKEAKLRSSTNHNDHSAINSRNGSDAAIVPGVEEGQAEIHKAVHVLPPPAPGVRRYQMTLAQLVPEKQHTGAEQPEDTDTSSTQEGDLRYGGTVIVETYENWAPIGAAHFDELVTSSDHFYNACRFFRVVDKFMVQFGINGDPKVQAKWRTQILQDDPVLTTNAYGTLTYATSGPNSRTTQLFINTNPKGNAFLDKQGFAPFGRIVQGMEFVEQINKEYKEKPEQGKIQHRGNEYLDKEFPRLSYIASLRPWTDGTATAREDTVQDSRPG